MDIERAIAILETGCKMPPVPHTSKDLDDACRVAVAALREKLEREKPEPLTIDELNGMDGLPVWVEFEPDVTGEKLTMWALLEVTDTIMLTNNLRGRSELLDDMTVEGWRATIYKYEPKEGGR